MRVGQILYGPSAGVSGRPSGTVVRRRNDVMMWSVGGVVMVPERSRTKSSCGVQAAS